MYVVIRTFVDLQDWQVVGGIRSYHRYIPGDVYPREGLTPTPERIRSLLTADNALRTPLIAVPVVEESEHGKAPEDTQEAHTAPEEAGDRDSPPVDGKPAGKPARKSSKGKTTVKKAAPKRSRAAGKKAGT